MPVFAHRRLAPVLIALAVSAVPAGALAADLSERAATDDLLAAAAHLRNDDLEEAGDVLVAALDRSAGSPELLTLLAQVRRRQGRLEDAMTAAEEAVAMADSYAPAHIELGDIYADLGWYESAIDSYRAAIRVDARAPAGRERHVRALLAAGRTAAAARQCRDYLAQAPTAALASLLGDALLAQGDLTGASAAFEQAIALDSRSAVAHCGRAEVLAARGKPGEAVTAARRALAIDPDLARAHACLGEACATSGDFLGAYGHAVKAERAGFDMTDVWSALNEADSGR